MAVSEQQRRELHQRLVDVLGTEEADVLMEHLPPTGWGDVARRSDVDQLGAVLRPELAAMGSNLRAEMAGLTVELRSEMAGLTVELRSEMAGLKGELRS
ncbi:MAG: hypothetical protein QOI78_5565, partial [Actinomycetota bacterium]|nr:hypothetical protein [Actinomycetota bacterium]